MTYKYISAVLVLALMAIAGIVAVGQYKARKMWWWIVIYWAVLTVKNLCDLLGLAAN